LTPTSRYTGQSQEQDQEHQNFTSPDSSPILTKFLLKPGHLALYLFTIEASPQNPFPRRNPAEPPKKKKKIQLFVIKNKKNKNQILNKTTSEQI
jgi:hypothetical protein